MGPATMVVLQCQTPLGAMLVLLDGQTEVSGP